MASSSNPPPLLNFFPSFVLPMNKKIENKLIKQAGVQYVAKRKDVKKYADSEVYN